MPSALFFMILITMCKLQKSEDFEESLPEMVSMSLAGIITNDNYTIGCIGLVMDQNMDERARDLMMSIRMNLKSYLVPVMMITSREVEKHEQTLCRRQQTVIVALKTYEPIMSTLNKYMTNRKIWQFLKWLLIMPIYPGGAPLTEWLDSQFPIDIAYDSKLAVFLKDQVMQIFRYQEGSPIVINTLGEYSTSKKKFEWHIKKTIKLNGIKFKIAVANQSISRVRYDNLTRQYTLYDGVYQKAWHLLENMLNFSTEIVFTKKHGWFRHPLNGVWTEVESLLVNKEVDAVVTPVLQSPVKNQDFFLSYPIYLRKYYIYVRDPADSLSLIPWDIFTSPFSWTLWAAIGASIFIISIVLNLLSMYFGRALYPEEASRYTLGNSFFAIYRAFCNQGQEDNPFSIPTRIVFITTYMTAMLVLASYSGVLISFLTTGRAVLPFDSFEQIYQDGSYQLGAPINSSGHFFFRNAKEDEVIHKIYVKQIMNNPKNLQSSLDEGFQRICQAKYAHILAIEIVINLENYPCKILQLQRDFITFKLSLAFQKNFRYSSLFTEAIQDLKDHGILSKWAKETSLRFAKKKEAVVTPSVDISQVTPLLVQLCCAILLSMIFLLIEKWCNKITLKKVKFKEEKPMVKDFFRPSTQMRRWPKLNWTLM